MSKFAQMGSQHSIVQEYKKSWQQKIEPIQACIDFVHGIIFRVVDDGTQVWKDGYVLPACLD